MVRKLTEKGPLRPRTGLFLIQALTLGVVLGPIRTGLKAARDRVKSLSLFRAERSEGEYERSVHKHNISHWKALEQNFPMRFAAMLDIWWR